MPVPAGLSRKPKRRGAQKGPLRRAFRRGGERPGSAKQIRRGLARVGDISQLPHTFVLDHRPAGYAKASAAKGELVEIAVREFTSSEDGELLVSRLEGLPTDLLRRLPSESAVAPSRVDHLLAIIHPDLTTTLYVNECNIVAQGISARALAEGEEVGEDDLLDIVRVDFDGVAFPAEAGFVCVFSAGWRKGMFFDIAPLLPEGSSRSYDVNDVLGGYFAYLHNQSVFSLTETDWEHLFRQRWFPFSTLPKALVREMINASRDERGVDLLLERIADAVRQLAPRMLERWRTAPLLAESHGPLLERAVERYLATDYESATAILFPRIEGILRTIRNEFGGSARTTSSGLVEAVGDRHKSHAYSWLLPEAFRRFLKTVYFANFSPGQPAELSRHSVGHGVADPSDFDLKSASLGLLIVDQLWCLIPKDDRAVHQ